MDAATTDAQNTAPRLSFWDRRVSRTVATVLLVVGGLFVIVPWIKVFDQYATTDCVCPPSKGDIKSLETTTIRYRTYTGAWPTSLEDFVRRPANHIGPWRQMVKEGGLSDPWGQPYQYRNPGKHNAQGYDIFSKGPDMKEDTDDDIGNWQN